MGLVRTPPDTEAVGIEGEVRDEGAHGVGGGGLIWGPLAVTFTCDDSINGRTL